MAYISLQENYNRVRNLIQMAKRDGQVNVAELTFIVWVSQKLGISKSELDELSQEEGNYSYPITEEQRKDILFDLIKVMYVDGIVAESELELCEDLANQMNLDKEKTAKLISHIKDNSNSLMEKSDFDLIYS